MTTRTNQRQAPAQQQPPQQTQAQRPAQAPAAQPPAQQQPQQQLGMAPVERVATLRKVLGGSQQQLVNAIGKNLLSPERLARCVMTEFQKNDALWDCCPLSIASCMIQAGQLGLEIGGTTGQSYMVPFKNNKRGGIQEAQFLVGYRGLIALAYRSGHVKKFFAHVVYANDLFEIELGSDPRIRHKPALGEDRGVPIGCYAVVHLKDAEPDFEFMSWDEIQKHKNKYSKGINRQDSPWRTAEEEMAKKTLIRKLAKRCPLAIEVQEVIDTEDRQQAIVVAAQQPPRTEGLTNRMTEALNGHTEGGAQAGGPTIDVPPEGHGEQPKLAEGEIPNDEDEPAKMTEWSENPDADPVRQ